MEISASTDREIDDERVIDRSGDIDQRPPDERTGLHIAAPASFSALPEKIASLPAIASPAAAPQSAHFRALPANLIEMAGRLQKDLDKQYAKAKSQLEALGQKIESQEKRCVAPKLDDELQQIRFQRQKILITNGPDLATSLREERSRLADLEHFKNSNRLVRDAHYPQSAILGLGILFVLVVVEAGINGVLFADSSDQGFFGGWLEALVLSITNTGTAFLSGRLIFPQLHRRGVITRSAALVLTAAGIAAVIAINLFGAHYRDYRASSVPGAAPRQAVLKREPFVLAGPKQSSARSFPRKIPKPQVEDAPLPAEYPVANAKMNEREAIQKISNAPFAFGSFMSFFLFVTGLCAASIAAADGYKFDDPYPGYGKRHRRYMEARAASGEAIRRILAQSNAIMTGHFQTISRKLETFAQEMSTLITLHHSYASDHRELSDRLEESARDAEAEIACHERLTNKVRGTEVVGVAIRQLPPLREKQIRFFESQDKKLKALQKGLQKEQNDALGIFDEASSDFQKLLASASKASLEAALGFATAASSKSP